MLTITPIIENVTILAVDGNQVVWQDFDDSSQKYDLFLFDGQQTIQIADNGNYSDTQLDDGQVVWSQNDGHDSEIFLYNGEQTLQLTDDDLDDKSLEISDGQILWYRYNEDDIPEILLYDNGGSVQVTNDGIEKRNGQFYGGGIVWERLDPVEEGENYNYEIWLYNDGQTSKLSDNQTEDILIAVEGNYILWSSYDRIDETKQLLLYDGVETKQLTTDGVSNVTYTDIVGQNVVWIENSIPFLYDGSTTQQIGDDQFRFSNSPVQIDGNKLVWLSGYNRFSDPEIYLYDGSTFTQITDNTYVMETNVQAIGDTIVWESYEYQWLPSNPPTDYNTDILLYKDGQVSSLTTTIQDEHILSLDSNSLLGYIGSQIFLATWTDDTFLSLYDPAQYGASYRDLIQGYGYDLDGLKQHYHQYGISEGRSRDLFDELVYIASYSDLIGGYGGDSFEDVASQGATEHYLQYGLNEGRSPTLFDPVAYMQAYPDIAVGYNNDPIQATLHYITYGYDEGRSPALA